MNITTRYEIDHVAIFVEYDHASREAFIRCAGDEIHVGKIDSREGQEVVYQIMSALQKAVDIAETANIGANV